MNTLYIKYNKLFIKFDKINNDNEKSHILQDKIYRTVIKDISTNKFKTLEHIKHIGKYINKYIVKYDYNRWYA